MFWHVLRRVDTFSLADCHHRWAGHCTIHSSTWWACAQTSSFCAGRKFGRTRMDQEMDQEMDQDGKNCVLKFISVIGEF